MFQGIVGLGEVKKVKEKDNFRVLGIDVSGLADPKKGDSVAVNGVCLSAAELGDVIYFDVMGESLKKTNLGKLKEGDKVNIERPINLGTEISGHLIQGHIEKSSVITKKIEDGDNIKMYFSLPENLKDYIFPKGSIAIDGISLTAVDVDEKEFSVAIIPQTLKNSTLGFKKEGDDVNIETDFLLKIYRNNLAKKIENLEARIKELEND